MIRRRMGATASVLTLYSEIVSERLVVFEVKFPFVASAPSSMLNGVAASVQLSSKGSSDRAKSTTSSQNNPGHPRIIRENNPGHPLMTQLIGGCPGLCCSALKQHQREHQGAQGALIFRTEDILVRQLYPAELLKWTYKYLKYPLAAIKRANPYPPRPEELISGDNASYILNFVKEHTF